MNMRKHGIRVYLLVLLLSFAMAASVYTSTTAADGEYNHKQGYNGKSGIILTVEPPHNSINPGEVTQYSVEVASANPPTGLPYTAVGVIRLAIRGLPENTVGIFTPSMGLPDFESKLTVITGSDVKPGLYELTIFAFNKKNRILETAKVALSIGEAATATITHTATITVTETATTSTETPPATKGLKIEFSTDKFSYGPGEKVAVEGIITDESGNSIEGASVSIQVDNPSGSTIHINQTTTDEQGSFNDTFTLPGYALNGVYTVFVSAAYQEYHGASHSTFVVGESSIPAVTILSLNITATGGVQVASFEPGMEAVALVQVLNQGAALQNGMIWLEVDDSRDVPIYIGLISKGLGQGEKVTVEFHIFLDENAVEGVYRANAYVSDDYICRGGTFLDKEQSTFIVEKPSPNITTTTTTTNTLSTNTTSIESTSALTWTTTSTITATTTTNSTETTTETMTTSTETT
ncbi:MAG: MG2 domain-containing protein, partial [Candidatus Bathyarchaeia archaeon]